MIVFCMTEIYNPGNEFVDLTNFTGISSPPPYCMELRSHTLHIDARSSTIVQGGGLESQFNFFLRRQIIMLKHIKDGLTF